MARLRPRLARATRQVRTDLRADPYLGYILAGTLLLAGVWVWHGVPNFTTWDERDRILDPLVAYGAMLGDPGFQSLQQGVAWGREPFGATFYLYALVLLPVVLAAAVVGSLDAIVAIPYPDSDFGFYPVWQDTPAWIWSASVVAVRLTNVALSAVAVYLTYRIGTTLRDRATGRLAAVLLGTSFGLLTLAHEGGEDVPALCCLLLALYLLVRYVQDGEDTHLFEASAAGGAALAFKLTMAPVVVLVAVAHLLRARETPSWPASLWRPRLLAAGAAVGAVVVVLGFPTALVGRLDLFAERLFGHTEYRVDVVKGPDAPIWWWYLRAWVHTLGLPLFVAAVGGTLAGLARLRRRVDPGRVLLYATLVGFVAVFATWHDFRPHHLLPTLPVAALLTALALVRLRERRPTLGRVVVAVLVVTTAVYAGTGAAGYAGLPRDEATAWMDENVPRDATVEFYPRGIEEAAVPHWVDAQYPWAGGVAADPCPAYVQLTYRDLLYLRSVPEADRSHYVRTNTEARAAHVRSLLSGETYRIAAEFGQRPPGFVPRRPDPGSLTALVRLGIVPHTDQYADEQELRANQYVAILERRGECTGTRTLPE